MPLSVSILCVFELLFLCSFPSSSTCLSLPPFAALPVPNHLPAFETECGKQKQNHTLPRGVRLCCLYPWLCLCHCSLSLLSLSLCSISLSFSLSLSLYLSCGHCLCLEASLAGCCPICRQLGKQSPSTHTLHTHTHIQSTHTHTFLPCVCACVGYQLGGIYGSVCAQLKLPFRFSF